MIRACCPGPCRWSRRWPPWCWWTTPCGRKRSAGDPASQTFRCADGHAPATPVWPSGKPFRHVPETPRMTNTWRAKAWNLLEEGRTDSWARTAVKVFLGAVIVGSVAAVAVETLPALARRADAFFALIERIVVTVLTVEYALRLWVAPQDPRAGPRRPWRARLTYALSPLGVIDLL